MAVFFGSSSSSSLPLPSLPFPSLRSALSHGILESCSISRQKRIQFLVYSKISGWFKPHLPSPFGLLSSGSLLPKYWIRNTYQLVTSRMKPIGQVWGCIKLVEPLGKGYLPPFPSPLYLVKNGWHYLKCPTHTIFFVGTYIWWWVLWVSCGQKQYPLVAWAPRSNIHSKKPSPKVF